MESNYSKDLTQTIFALIQKLIFFSRMLRDSSPRFVGPSVHPSIHPSICPSVRRSIRLSVGPLVRPSVHPSVTLYFFVL